MDRPDSPEKALRGEIARLGQELEQTHVALEDAHAEIAALIGELDGLRSQTERLVRQHSSELARLVTDALRVVTPRPLPSEHLAEGRSLAARFFHPVVFSCGDARHFGQRAIERRAITACGMFLRVLDRQERRHLLGDRRHDELVDRDALALRDDFQQRVNGLGQLQANGVHRGNIGDTGNRERHSTCAALTSRRIVCLTRVDRSWRTVTVCAPTSP